MELSRAAAEELKATAEEELVWRKTRDRGEERGRR